MATPLDTNLLLNPGAEAGTAAVDDGIVAVPYWTTTSNFTVDAYGAVDSDLSINQSTSYGGQVNFFYGGPSNTLSTASQIVSFADLAGPVDAGQVTATVSGYFGGFATQDDHLDIQVSFLDLNGQPVGDTYILVGPLAAARDDNSELLFETGTVKVPTGAVSADYEMIATREEGSDNDGIADNVSFVLDIACFCHGTMISTPAGEVPVQSLSVGDRVLTASGAAKPIRWIGRRRVACRRHPKPQTVWPVRIRSGAFGAGRPQRDLWLSPDHAVWLFDVLIPIKYLINGTSIAQVPVAEVTYYHVELPRHDILLADGLAAESYLDIGDRAHFGNVTIPMTLHPDFATQREGAHLIWDALGCAPLVVSGPVLDMARHVVAAACIDAQRHAVCA